MNADAPMGDPRPRSRSGEPANTRHASPAVRRAGTVKALYVRIHELETELVGVYDTCFAQRDRITELEATVRALQAGPDLTNGAPECREP